MLKKNEVPPLGAVSSLSVGVVEPNPQRVAALKQWHIDQAISEAKPVAIINFTLAANGEISSKSIGLEPEHAKVMLPALEDAAQKLRDQVGEEAPPLFSYTKLHSPGRQRDAMNPNGYVCRTCSNSFRLSQLHLLTARSSDGTASEKKLICSPCLEVVAIAANLKPKLKIV